MRYLLMVALLFACHSAVAQPSLTGPNVGPHAIELSSANGSGLNLQPNANGTPYTCPSDNLEGCLSVETDAAGETYWRAQVTGGPSFPLDSDIDWRRVFVDDGSITDGEVVYDMSDPASTLDRFVQRGLTDANHRFYPVAGHNTTLKFFAIEATGAFGSAEGCEAQLNYHNGTSASVISNILTGNRSSPDTDQIIVCTWKNYANALEGMQVAGEYCVIEVDQLMAFNGYVELRITDPEDVTYGSFGSNNCGSNGDDTEACVCTSFRSANWALGFEVELRRD